MPPLEKGALRVFIQRHEWFMGRVGRTLIVLVLLAGSGDCALFLVLRRQPYDYFSFFSSSVLNPLHHMQILCCRVLVHFICFTAFLCYISGLFLCPFRGNLPFQVLMLTWSMTVSHCPGNVLQSLRNGGKNPPKEEPFPNFPSSPTST